MFPLLIIMFVALISYRHARLELISALFSLSPWILSMTFYLFLYCIYPTTVCPNPWPPGIHSSPKYLERYWLTCMKVCTLNGRWPSLLTLQHVLQPGCSVNLVGECQYLGFFLVYQLLYFIFILNNLPK